MAMNVRLQRWNPDGSTTIVREWDGYNSGVGDWVVDNPPTAGWYVYGIVFQDTAGDDIEVHRKRLIVFLAKK
jgi:hypothetical protein